MFKAALNNPIVRWGKDSKRDKWALLTWLVAIYLPALLIALLISAIGGFKSTSTVFGVILVVASVLFAILFGVQMMLRKTIRSL